MQDKETTKDVNCVANPDALVLKKGKGHIAIRKDAVVTVEYTNYGARNIGCIVNGIETQSGYDFVIRGLGWLLRECY